MTGFGHLACSLNDIIQETFDYSSQTPRNVLHLLYSYVCTVHSCALMFNNLTSKSCLKLESGTLALTDP